VKGLFGSNFSHLKALNSINFRSFDTDESEINFQSKKRKDFDISSNSECHEGVNGMEYNIAQAEENKEKLRKLTKKAKRALSKSYKKDIKDGLLTSPASPPTNISNHKYINNESFHFSEVNSLDMSPVVDIGYVFGALELSDSIVEKSQESEGHVANSVDNMESIGCWVQCPIKAISHR